MSAHVVNKIIAGLLLIFYGFWRLQEQKKNAKQDVDEFESIRAQYVEKPITKGFFDSLIALFGTGVPRSVSIVFVHFFSWGPILMGTAAFLDALNELLR